MPFGSARIAAFLAALAAAPAAPAAGQVLRVEAGEHDGFTRLVIPIGADRDWTLEPLDATWRLDLAPPVDGFDLSRSFDLIPRTRVAELAQDGSSLSVRLACPCGIEAFRYRDRFLVLDVAETQVPEADGPAAARSRTRRNAERQETAAALPDLARLLTARRDPGFDPNAGAVAAPEGPFPQGVGPETEAPIARRVDHDGPPPTAVPRQADVDLEEAARIMAEQMARAAAAGLLDAAPGRPLQDGDPMPSAAPPVPAAPEPAGAPSPSSAIPPAGQILRPEAHPPAAPAATAGATAPERGPVESAGIPPAAPSGRHETDGAALTAMPDEVVRDRDEPSPPPAIRARTAFDLALSPLPDPGAEQTRLACTGDATGMAGWSDGPLHDGLGALRRAVFDDRDRLDRAATISLARHYLHHGFGAEAIFWLSQLPEPPADLLALGRLIEGFGQDAYPLATDPARCSDEEFLLRYLSGAVDGSLTQGQADRLQLAYAGLPEALRHRFGADLARRLAADGRTGTARNVRDMLERSGRTPAEVLVLDLDLGASAGTSPADTAEVDRARRILSGAIRDDGASPADTMAHALALDRSAGRRPDPVRVTAAEALLRETPVGRTSDRLWHELAAARARMGQVDTAIAMLRSGRGTRDAEVWQRALTEVIADRVASEDTAALLILSHLFGTRWDAGGSEAGRIRVAAADRLRTAGLGEAAALLEANGPGLVLPSRGTEAPGGRTAEEAWADADWAQAARLHTGAPAEVARRMADRAAARASLAAEPGPDASAPGLAGSGGPVELEAIAAALEDTRVLRDAIVDLLAGSQVSTDGENAR